MKNKHFSPSNDHDWTIPNVRTIKQPAVNIRCILWLKHTKFDGTVDNYCNAVIALFSVPLVNLVLNYILRYFKGFCGGF